MLSLNIAYCFPRNFVFPFSNETGQLCPRSASLYWAAPGWAGGYQVRGGRLVCVPAAQLLGTSCSQSHAVLSAGHSSTQLPQPRSSDRTPARGLCSSRGNHGQKSAILWPWCVQKPVEEASEWWQLEHSRI